MLPSPRVTANGAPTGRQPWLTTARRSTGPTRATPAAPPSSTSVPHSSRWRPRSVAPDTMPPITGRPGCSALRRSRKLSAGKVNGSASSTTLAWSPSGRSGQPPMPTPSSRGRTRSPNGRTSTPGSRASQTASPGTSSSSRPPPITPWAVQPRMLAVPVRSDRLRAMPPAALACSIEKKQTTRSGAPPTCSRAAGMTSSRAWAWSEAVEMAAPKVSMGADYNVLDGARRPGRPTRSGSGRGGRTRRPDEAVAGHGLDQPLVPGDLELDGDAPGVAGQLAAAGVAQQPRAPAAALAAELGHVDLSSEPLTLEVGHGLGQLAHDQPVAAHHPEDR